MRGITERITKLWITGFEWVCVRYIGSSVTEGMWGLDMPFLARGISGTQRPFGYREKSDDDRDRTTPAQRMKSQN